MPGICAIDFILLLLEHSSSISNFLLHPNLLSSFPFCICTSQVWPIRKSFLPFSLIFERILPISLLLLIIKFLKWKEYSHSLFIFTCLILWILLSELPDIYLENLVSDSLFTKLKTSSILFNRALVYIWNISTPIPTLYSCWCIVFITIRVNFLSESWIVLLRKLKNFLS